MSDDTPSPAASGAPAGPAAAPAAGPSAAPSAAQIAALVDAQSAAIGLNLAREHHPGTVQNLALIAQMAQLVMSFPLSQHIEPAAVFSHAKS